MFYSGGKSGCGNGSNFVLVYASQDTKGQRFPKGEDRAICFNGNVNPGDILLMKLSISKAAGAVIGAVKDYMTGAAAWVRIPSHGESTFIGFKDPRYPSAAVDSRGFTGVMMNVESTTQLSDNIVRGNAFVFTRGESSSVDFVVGAFGLAYKKVLYEDPVYKIYRDCALMGEGSGAKFSLDGKVKYLKDNAGNEHAAVIIYEGADAYK